MAYRIGPTCTEQDFAAYLVDLLAQRNDKTRWHLIMDNLNIHCSEAVVRLVSEVCKLQKPSRHLLQYMNLDIGDAFRKA